MSKKKDAKAAMDTMLAIYPWNNLPWYPSPWRTNNPHSVASSSRLHVINGHHAKDFVLIILVEESIRVEILPYRIFLVFGYNAFHVFP